MTCMNKFGRFAKPRMIDTIVESGPKWVLRGKR